MDITQSPRSLALQRQVEDFMSKHLYPIERDLYLAVERMGPWAVYPYIEDLKKLARKQSSGFVTTNKKGWLNFGYTVIN